MKRIFATAVMICAFICSFAAPVNRAVRNGNWMNTSTWSLNRLPQSGDTVWIPKNNTVLVNQILDYNQQDLYLRIEGVLMMDNGKMELSNRSTIAVMDAQAAVLPDKNNPSNRISIGGIDRYTGKEGIVNGPAYLNGAVPSFTPTTFQVLPVKFISFSAVNTNEGVLVQWATSEEINADRYAVERSEDGINWNTIAYVQAAGNSNTIKNYTHLNRRKVEKVAYFRIRQIDLDGRYTYTAIASVKATGAALASAVTISSNLNNGVLIRFGQAVNTHVQVQIINMNGQVIAQQQFAQPGNQLVLNKVVAAKGTYIVSVTDSHGLKTSRQVIL